METEEGGCCRWPRWLKINCPSLVLCVALGPGLISLSLIFKMGLSMLPLLAGRGDESHEVISVKCFPERLAGCKRSANICRVNQ